MDKRPDARARAAAREALASPEARARLAAADSPEARAERLQTIREAAPPAAGSARRMLRIALWAALVAGLSIVMSGLIHNSGRAARDALRRIMRSVLDGSGANASDLATVAARVKSVAAAARLARDPRSEAGWEKIQMMVDVARSGAGDGRAEAVSPRGGILTLQPRFEAAVGSGGGTGARVFLKKAGDATAAERFFDIFTPGEAAGTFVFTLPDGAGLAAGIDYVWSVAPLDAAKAADLERRSAEQTFTIVDEAAAAAALAFDATGSHEEDLLLRASILLELQLFGDARKTLSNFPSEAGAGAQLVACYLEAEAAAELGDRNRVLEVRRRSLELQQKLVGEK